MDEQKKPVGRPQIYQGWQPEQRDRRRTKPAQRPQEERRKGEYRPLAVTEQSVQLSSASERKLQPENRETDQDLVRIPKTDLRKVTQMPVQREVQKRNQKPVQRELQQINTKPIQHEPQQTDSKPIQREAQQVNPKPIQRKPQQVKPNPVQREPQQVNPNLVQRKPQQANPNQMRQPEQKVMKPEEQKKMAVAKRRREQESEIKMHFLWAAFGVLSVVLALAVFYEIILGHGIKETGAERMEEQKQELIVDTEERNIEILTPGGELVSEIKERENRRNLPKQTEMEAQSVTEVQTEAGDISIQ